MTTNTIDWSFNGTWPYPPQWFETPEGRLHYVDEGPRDGRPVVLVHGNPSWGYLFRNFIPPLVAAGYRVIVPDHLGFGRSDKPDAADGYGIEQHARRLDALLESLDLHNTTVVPHDWGGPVGLYWAVQHRNRVQSVVLLNTFLHRPTGPVALTLPLRIFRIPGLGELLVKGLHLIVRAFLLGGGVLRHDRLTAVVRNAYLAPHPDWSSRSGALAFARQFPDGPHGAVADFQDRVHQGLIKAPALPAAIIWANDDVVLDQSILHRWQQDFPKAETLRLKGTGHFLQEDAHEEVVPALLKFLQSPRIAPR